MSGDRGVNGPSSTKRVPRRPGRLNVSPAQRILAIGALLLVAACQAASPTQSATSPTDSSLASAAPSPASTATVPNPTIAAPTVEPSQPPAASATPSPAWTAQPQPSLALQASGAPALPTKVAVVDTSTACDLGTGESCVRWKASWLEANPTDVTVRVYGVTTCLHEPTASSVGDVKCLKSGDFIPPASLVLLAEAPATDASTTFDLAIGETSGVGWLPGAGPTVYAVIMQAVNDKGGSIFAFALVSGSCWGCVL